MSRSARKVINLALIGAHGRMGKEIQKLIRGSKTFRLATGFQHADVIIDFSSPAGLQDAIKLSLQHKTPLVSGTTGISQADKRKLKALSKKVPVLYSANMSPGVALFTNLLKNFESIADWDFKMEESHHRHKKDKPSGTALLLQQILKDSIGNKMVPIRSFRIGEVPGTHQIKAIGPDETLTIQHVALNRRVFARGALSAARWLFDKKRPGLYNLSDLHK